MVMVESFHLVIIKGTIFIETWVFRVLAPAEVDVGGLFPDEGSVTWAGTCVLPTDTFLGCLLLVFLSLAFLG